MVLAQVDLGEGVEQAWSDFAAFVPKFLGFLVILVIGWIVARLVAKGLDAVLERVGFDRAVERGGIRQALARTDYDASDIVSRLVFWAILLIVLQLAFGVFGPNPVSELIQGVIAYLPQVLAAILIVVVAAAVAGVAREIVVATLGGHRYGRTLASGASAAILTVGLFAALNQLRIAPAIVNGLFYALLAVVAGSAIIAIGGGGVQPMRDRWERMMQRWDEERPRLQEQMEGADERIRERAEAGTQQLRQEVRGEAAVRTPTTGEAPPPRRMR